MTVDLINVWAVQEARRFTNHTEIQSNLRIAGYRQRTIQKSFHNFALHHAGTSKEISFECLEKHKSSRAKQEFKLSLALPVTAFPEFYIRFIAETYTSLV